MHKRAWIGVSGMVASAALIAGCSGSGAGATEEPELPEPTVSVEGVAEGPGGDPAPVGVTEPVTLTTSGPDPQMVHLEPAGADLPESLPVQVRGDSITVPPESLEYGTVYTLGVTLDETDTHRAGPAWTSFATPTPTNLTAATVIPPAGTAELLTVQFDEPIPDRRLAADHITVTGPSGGAVDGRWRWTGASTAEFRPAAFWEPHSDFQVRVDVYGVDLGDGLYGEFDTIESFRTGEDWQVQVEDATKTITVTRDGEVMRVMPTSMGKPGYDTPPGIYVVGAEKNESMIMDSATYGVTDGPEAYRTPVQWATRISYSGIFIHAAPWSLDSQGYENTSHGCLNVSDDDGRWFLENVPVGAPVIVSGTAGPELPGYDGLGYWNIPLDEWEFSADQW